MTWFGEVRDVRSAAISIYGGSILTTTTTTTAAIDLSSLVNYFQQETPEELSNMLNLLATAFHKEYAARFPPD